MIITDAVEKWATGRQGHAGEERSLRHINPGLGGSLQDLRRFLSERELLNVCLEAVQALNLTRAELVRLKLGEFRPQMMFTLLTFAYATRVYGSEDIASDLRQDPTLRYICARKYPDARTIRHFRRLSRARLEECLAQVFEQAWRMAFRPVDTDFAFYHWVDGRLSVLARQRAQERIELAIITDTAMSEW